MLQAYNG